MQFRRRVVARASMSLFVLALFAVVTPAKSWDRGSVETFATLPVGATGPEGLTVASDGKVYVTTFGFNGSTPGGLPGPGQLYAFDANGTLLRQVSVAGSSLHLLGLAFHPTTHVLLVIDFGNAKVLAVDPQTGAASPFMTAPTIAPFRPGLNALTFDSSGNVYVSDSFQGVIWRTDS